MVSCFLIHCFRLLRFSAGYPGHSEKVVTESVEVDCNSRFTCSL